MACFRFADGAGMFDSTPIENLFLMEYLPAAPEKFLRVYLYARMLALHPELGGDMAALADSLRMEAEDVYSAFAYWEQRGLARRLSDKPPTFELLPVRAEEMSTTVPTDKEYYAYRDFNSSLQALFPSKLIDNHEYRIANDWLNVLGYDQAAVLRLVEYGISTSRSPNRTPSPSSVFKRMDKIAAKWADRGCRTLEDVERAIAEQEDVYPVARAVLKRFALRRDPTLDELECVKRWMGEWGFTQEQILEACVETTKSRTPSFAYLDAVLKSRREDTEGQWAELSEVLKELDSPQAQPTPDLLKSYAALRAEGFEAETIRLAAVQCHRKKKTGFGEMEWMLRQWGAQGIRTRQAAEAYIEDMRRKADRVRALLALCGLERRPTMNDLSLYEGWIADHDESVIEYAAGCARGMQVPMLYMDKLLADWRDSGVHTVEEAAARHEATRAKRAAQQASVQPVNPALNYEQREYREEDFGDDFFIDLDRYGEGGDKA